MRDFFHEGIPCYLDFPVTDWETFTNLLALGVTDILIDGPIAFDLETVNKRKGDTKIRVRPQASVNASLSYDDNENTFFIRPEDVDTYAPFIDIIEIFCEDKETEEVVYNIYKRKSFISDLSLLVKQLHRPVHNPYIMPDFARHRLTCGQVCMRQPGRCMMCKNALDLTQTLAKDFSRSKIS